MSNASAPDFRSHFTGLLRCALVEVAPDAANLPVILERPKSAQHGDYACSVAMQLAKPMKRNPREIAQALVRALPQSPYLEKAEIAGAGFVNLYLKPAAKQQVMRVVLEQRHAYGRVGAGGGRKVQVEFVSANPTGPLHVGHGRGAAYGASLASLLEAAGFAVTREYYVNDAGRQMDILALSTWLRYLEIAGAPLEFPAKAYQGDYVRDMARQIFETHGKRYVHRIDSLMRDLPPADRDPGIHLAGKVGIRCHLPSGEINRLEPGLDLLQSLVAGECAKSVDERFLLEQLPQFFGSTAGERVLDGKRAAQPVDVLGGVGTLCAFPARVIGPILLDFCDFRIAGH